MLLTARPDREDYSKKGQELEFYSAFCDITFGCTIQVRTAVKAAQQEAESLETSYNGRLTEVQMANSKDFGVPLQDIMFRCRGQ